MISAWEVLAARYGDTRLRAHSWGWVNATKTWLPVYRFQSALKIMDIWQEYHDDLNGCLPVRELDVTRTSKWRRNDGGLKTEAAWRNKVVELMEKLMKKPRWDLALALRFIRDRYEGSMTPRKICDEKRVRGLAVLVAAKSYL
jgi:hypothetical protein